MSPSRTLSDMSPATLQSSSSGSRSSMPRERHRKRFYKTRLCPYHFSRGANCKGGDHCSYAHSFIELRPSIDLTKTKLCTGYVNGSCPKPADECSFAHGCGDLRSYGSRDGYDGAPVTEGHPGTMKGDIYLCEGDNDLAQLLLEDNLCGLEREVFLTALSLPPALDGSLNLMDLNDSTALFLDQLSCAAVTEQDRFASQS